MPEVDTGDGMNSHSYDFVSRTGIAGGSEREGGRGVSNVVRSG